MKAYPSNLQFECVLIAGTITFVILGRYLIVTAIRNSDSIQRQYLRGFEGLPTALVYEEGSSVRRFRRGCAGALGVTFILMAIWSAIGAIVTLVSSK
jgi:hypothetical protein